MREIMFRGQTRRYGEKVNMNGDKLPSKWVYGGIFPGVGVYSIIYGGEKEDFTGAEIDKHVVYSNTVGQYTGLRDKRGKQIFEGDILEVTWYAPRREPVHEIHEVVYSRSGFFTKRNGKLCGQVSNYISPNVNMRCEIIGNIYDNPELLKGGGNDGD